MDFWRKRVRRQRLRLGVNSVIRPLYHRACWTFAVLLVMPAHASTQVIPDSIAGCYQMTIDGQLEYELPPQQFTLMSEMGANGFEADDYLIRPVTASPGGRYRWAYWHPMGQDSVLMIWTTGFTVTSVHVEARGDTLHGRIVQRDDVIIEGERDPEARVIVVRSQC